MAGIRFATLASLAVSVSACFVSNPYPALIPQSVRVRVAAEGFCLETQACVHLAVTQSLIGILIYADGDTLSLYSQKRGGRVSIPASKISKIEVERGRKASAGAVAKGAGLGAIAGAAIGAAVGATGEALFGGIFGGKRDYGKAVGESAAEGLVQGAFAGAAIGAAVGETVWHEVTVRQLREEMCHCRIRQPETRAP